MSIEAIHWALNYAPIPPERRDASSLAIVLVGLANHADPDGNNAFPSLTTLTRYTRLTERSVRYALRSLQDLHLITPSNPNIVAAYITRADRRPNGYNLALTHTPVDNSGHPVDKSTSDGPSGRQTVPPADQDEGQTPQQRGAENNTTGGKHCPRTVLNPPGNRPSRAPARKAAAQPRRTSRPSQHRVTVPPPCGECDARPGDGIAARVTESDTDPGRVQLCPRCHPANLTATTASPAAGDR